MRQDELRMFNLLDEIDEACKKKATYFLIGDELLYHETGRRVYSCVADICMTLKDFNIIKKELELNDDRIFECIDTNKDMPGLYYRYVDTSTLLIQPEYHKVRKEHGIAVNIHILRSTSKESEMLCEYEDIMESEIEGINRSVSTRKKRYFESAKKRNRLTDKLKDLLRSAALDDISKDSILKIPAFGVFRFPAKYWEGGKYITIDKKKYRTVLSPEPFLLQCYGDSYAEKNYRPCSEFFRMIVYSDISYQDMDEVFWNKFNFDPEFWKRREDIKEFYFNEWVKLDEGLRIHQDEFYVQRSRFWLWKRYYFNKDSLKKLLKEKRYDELLLIFRDLDIHLRDHMKYKKIPFFDKDIIDMYCETLEMNGDKDRSDVLKELIKVSPMDELDSKYIESFYSDIPQETINIRKYHR